VVLFCCCVSGLEVILGVICLVLRDFVMFFSGFLVVRFYSVCFVRNYLRMLVLS